MQIVAVNERERAIDRNAELYARQGPCRPPSLASMMSWTRDMATTDSVSGSLPMLNLATEAAGEVTPGEATKATATEAAAARLTAATGSVVDLPLLRVPSRWPASRTNVSSTSPRGARSPLAVLLVDRFMEEAENIGVDYTAQAR